MIFLDTASIESIIKFRSIIAGVTTNPKIITNTAPEDVVALYRADPIRGTKLLLEKIKEIDRDLVVSVEVVTEDMFDEALEYHELGAVVKVPVLPETFGLIRELAKRDMDVNATVIMSETQAYLAAMAGATYVSVFYNRIRDVGGDPCKIIRNVRKLLEMEDLETSIIAGSIRNPYDVTDALLCGAHIVTAPPKLFEKMLYHPKSKETVEEFDKAWRI